MSDSLGDIFGGGDALIDGSGGSTGDSGGSGFFGSLLSGLSNPNTIRGIVGAGTQLLGSGITSSANTTAANTAAQAARDAAMIQAQSNQQAIDKTLAAQQQARDEFRAASGRGIADITQGTADYANTISPLLTPAPISMPTYRGLTTQQQTGETDLLRNADAQLASSGLRGSGRAGIGAVLDQDRRYQEDARAGNDASMLQSRQTAQNVANTARTGLAQVQAQAGGSKANTELLTGNQLGSSLQAGGNTASQLTANTGATNAAALNNAAGFQANAGLANANNQAGTLGSIAGAFSTPFTIGAGNPNVPGLGGAGTGTGYVDTGSWQV